MSPKVCKLKETPSLTLGKVTGMIGLSGMMRMIRVTWKEEEKKVLIERISNCCWKNEGIMEDRATHYPANAMDAGRLIIA